MNYYSLKNLTSISVIWMLYAVFPTFIQDSHTQKISFHKTDISSEYAHTKIIFHSPWEDNKHNTHNSDCKHFPNHTAFTWIGLADAQLTRAESQSAIINAKLYVFGGFESLVPNTFDELVASNTVEVYDPATDTWTYLRSMPRAVTHLGVATDGEDIWFPGGFEGNNPGVAINKVQIYNVNTDTWRDGPDLPEPMASHGTVRLDRKIHVFGGLKPDRQTNNESHYFLDLDNQAAGWQAAASMPSARNHHAGITAGGKIYAIGGQYGHDASYQDLNLVHAYDPYSDTWTRVADLPYPRSHFEHCTFSTLDGKIVIIGGRRDSDATYSNDAITEYNPTANTWTELERLPLGLLAPNAGVINNELYVSHGGPTWQQPGNALYKTDFIRTPLNQLGFQPNNITVNIARNTTLQKPVFLWTSNGTTNYNINTGSFPSWLSLDAPTGSTSPNSKEIKLDLNASNLAVGTYNFTITATASAYSTATLNITLNVTETIKKVLYIYGNVNKFGYLPSQPEYANDPVPYDQMRLNDNSNLGMSGFKAAIEELGFEIEEAYDQDITLTEAFLNQYDAVILGSNQKTWAASEATVMNTWVRNGGGLIGYSDSGFGGRFNLPAPAGINNQQGRNSNGILMEQFGMFFFTDQGGAGGDNLVTDWRINHFLNTKSGVPRTLRFRGEGCSPIRINPNWAQKQPCDTIYQIARFQNGGAGGTVRISDPILGNNIQNYTIDCALAAAEIGQGRVIGVFDRNTFWNGGVGTDITEEDNRIFSQKLVQWAAQRTLLPNEIEISGELKQWHKVTLTMDGPQTSETDANNPFLNYRLNVTFTKGAKSYTVPGYYAADGEASETSATAGNKWKVHFAPDDTGLWEYQVSFRTGTDIAVSDETCTGIANYFDGYQGSFTVESNDKTGRDLRRKGRLSYEGGRYLKFKNGEYFLKVGADSPETFLAYADFDGTSRHEVRADDYNRIKTWATHVADWQVDNSAWQGTKGKGIIGAINYLAEKGNNSVSFLTYNAGGDGKNVWPFIAHNDKLHYDCSKLDQWEIVFEHADSKGMFLHFKTQETENDEGNAWALDNGALGKERKLYYRELIARFSHHLALNWNLGEENTQTTAQRQAMAQYFYDHDPYKNHIVLHTYPNQIEAVYNPLLGNNSRLSGVSIQTSFSSVHQETLKWINNSKNTPRPWVVANDEQGPAQRGVPPDEGYNGYTNTANPSQGEIRRQTLWGNLMAGGAGVEYYFGYLLPQNDLDCEDLRSRDQMWDYNRLAINLFYDYAVPFWEMENRNDLIENPTNTNSKYSLAKPGGLYLIYLPNGGSTNLNLEGYTINYTISWYNPRSGGLLQDGSVTMVTGPGIVDIGTPPSEITEDWVALVVSESIPLSVPSIGSPQEKEEEIDFKVYPNPATEQIRIEYHQENGGKAPEMKLYNGFAQLKTKGMLKKDSQHYWYLDLNLLKSHYPSGIYFIELRLKNKIFYKRIVIE